MKRLFYTLMSFLMLGSVIIMNQVNAQNNSFTDAKSALGDEYVILTSQQNSDAGRNGCAYVWDDGTHENSVGLTAGGDMMWMNYFTAMPGCEMIHTISLAWGLLNQDGGLCRVMLYDDPTDDGDPSDAVYLSEATTYVVNNDLDIFTSVSITPTLVTGGFFVAALYPNQFGGEYPGSIDQTSSQQNSWAVGNSTPFGFDEFNLMKSFT